jgi:translation initiation factor IF-3
MSGFLACNNRCLQKESKISEKRKRINHLITATQVRLIDQHGKQVGVVDINEAMQKAKEAQLDLVEIHSSVNPPVCRVMDYGKHLFESTKKKGQNKKKQRKSKFREMKLKPNIDVADLKIKVKKIAEFLTNGDKVKVSLRFRGREIIHNEQGTQLFDRVLSMLPEGYVLEVEPKLENKGLYMVITYSKNN